MVLRFFFYKSLFLCSFFWVYILLGFTIDLRTAVSPHFPASMEIILRGWACLEYYSISQLKTEVIVAVLSGQKRHGN